MPPRSNIEVVGEPYLLDTPKGRVTVIPGTINANLKAKTIEEIQEQRRELHMSFVENVVEEVMRDILLQRRHRLKTIYYHRCAMWGLRTRVESGTVPRTHC